MSSNSPILTQQSRPVNFEIDDISKLSHDMYQFMLEHNGVGLAAPQIGNNITFFVMGDKESYKGIVNPQILAYSDNTTTDKEGCLSFPKLYLNVNRPEWIDVKYFNIDGKEITERLDGLWARCYCHELDHLNGVVFTSHVGKTALFLARDKQKKLLRRFK